MAAAQAALAKTRAEIAAASTQAKPAELLLRWNELIAAEGKTEALLLRTSLAEIGERWAAHAEQAAMLDDALPDLAHYRLVRAVHESVKHAPAEGIGAQHLLVWLCARRVALTLGWGAAELRWLQDAISTGRWVGVRRPGAPLLEGSGFVPQEGSTPVAARAGPATLLSWLGQGPAGHEGDAPKVAVADLLGVWVGSSVFLQQRQPPCATLPAMWMKLAESHAQGWRRCAQASAVVLKRLWGAVAPGTFVGLANGDSAIVVRAAASANDCLVLRVCSSAGSNYTELPRRSPMLPDHTLRGILPVGEISVRLNHERVVEKAFGQIG